MTVQKDLLSDPYFGLYIKTYGCQMNSYDSKRIEEILHPLGFRLIDDLQKADLVVLNTCHIREKAEDKLFSDLGRLYVIKQARLQQEKDMLIVVAGCTGQALGVRILKKTPYVNAVVGPQTYYMLPEIVTRIRRQAGHVVKVGFPKIAKFDQISSKRPAQGASAFLSIQEGCNKFCRFCVVPYTRGPEYCRPIDDILSEAQQFIQKGTKEITLLGQNVSAYRQHHKGSLWNLGMLLYRLAEMPGLQRLHYLTSHPNDIHEELLCAHRDIKILLPILHLPVQSGSDKILAHMNRKYTAAFYLDVIERFRTYNPHITFSSDFIVGYPGETQEDFEETLKIVHAVQYAQAFSFKYSTRPGTPAAALTPQIPEDIKNERLTILQTLLNTYRHQFNKKFIEKSLDVMIEGQKNGMYVGKSPFSQLIYFSSEKIFAKGDIVPVTIDKSSTHSLQGKNLAS